MSVLRGVRVVEIPGRGVAAWAGSHLADWGAQVQVIEPPGGSPVRSEGALWTWLSRGKRSVEADVDLPATDAIELCRRADLVVADSEAVPAALGLDARALG